MRETKENMLQWHPAFFAGIQIELAEEAEHLVFESEHTLSTKPMQIDVLIIKKQTKKKIRKNIGRIFKGHNIIEYKSPDDTLTIDDFYKVYGYACFYKADTGKTDEIKIYDLTLTFVCYHYPRKMLGHLKMNRHFSIEKMDTGIYYIVGDILSIQLIMVPELSEENNLWLHSLTNELKTNRQAEELICAYKGHENENIYQSVMDIIVRSNMKLFQEDGEMCDALMEIMKDKLDEREKKGFADGFTNGSESQLLSQIRKKITKGKSLPVIADELEETVESIQPLYDRVQSEMKTENSIQNV